MVLEASESNVEEHSPNPSTKDQVQEVYWGTSDNPRPTFVDAHIKGNEIEDFVYFLREFVDCFALTYAEMSGLDLEKSVHKLNISKDVKPIKQDQCHTKPEIMEKIKKRSTKASGCPIYKERTTP